MKTENLAEEKKVNNWTQYFWVFIGLAGFTFSLVVLYLAMRAVMDVGGYCAEGGAYNVAVHCPRGVAYLTPLSIFGLFVFGTVYITNALMDDWNVSYLFWPALFGALGWNFLDYSLQKLKVGQWAIGWWLCTLVFFGLALAPILVVDRKTWEWLIASWRDHKTFSGQKLIYILCQLAAIGLGVFGGIGLIGVL